MFSNGLVGSCITGWGLLLCIDTSVKTLFNCINKEWDHKNFNFFHMPTVSLWKYVHILLSLRFRRKICFVLFCFPLNMMTALRLQVISIVTIWGISSQENALTDLLTLSLIFQFYFHVDFCLIVFFIVYSCSG